MGTPGDLIKAASEALTEPVRELLLKLAGPFCEEVGEGLRYPGLYFKVAMANKFFELTKRMIERGGYEPKAVPPKLLLPVLQNATVEEDDCLHAKWAALLANAADPERTSPMPPSFPEILKQLSPFDAALLDNMWQDVIERREKLGGFYGVTREHVAAASRWSERALRRLCGERHVLPDLAFLSYENDGESVFENPYEAMFGLGVDNLVRLGLVMRTNDPEMDQNVRSHTINFAIMYYISILGEQFVQACNVPEKRNKVVTASGGVNGR